MSQRAQVKHRRHQWKCTATERGDQDRSLRKQLARVKAERDQAKQALKETQARLRQLTSQPQAVAVWPKVDVVWLSLRLFWEVHIGFRAVSRVLSLLAQALGIQQAPCAHTLIHWVIRLSIVRLQSARLLPGLPLSRAPLSHGLIWMIESSIGLGTGKIVAVVALDAQHHHLTPGAPALEHARCLGVSVADAWTGETIAELLGRVIAQVGRPAASLNDAGSALQKAVALLDERGLASPCIDDISHAAAGMLKRSDHHHPAFERFLSACGRVSGKLTHTLLACVAPPTVRTTARCMHVHRLFSWADRVRTLSPAGGAKTGSTWATLRVCLDELPTCKALITRFRADASVLLECQKILKTTGLSAATRSQCEPLIDAMPSAALRRECRASLDCQLETATRLGLDHVGVPISSETIASLFGVATHHGVGQTQDAARIALRLPAFCGVPTREEAEQVPCFTADAPFLTVSVARQQDLTAQCTSLTQQRREVLGHPERLENLGRAQGTPHVELLPSPKKQPNCQEIINISTRYENPYGPQLARLDDALLIENAAPPGMRETALALWIQKLVKGQRPIWTP